MRCWRNRDGCVSLAIGGFWKLGKRVAIATFIVVATHITAMVLIWIVPRFKKLADAFGDEMWTPVLVLVTVSDAVAKRWDMYLPMIFTASVFFVVVPLFRNQSCDRSITRSISVPLQLRAFA